MIASVPSHGCRSVPRHVMLFDCQRNLRLRACHDSRSSASKFFQNRFRWCAVISIAGVHGSGRTRAVARCRSLLDDALDRETIGSGLLGEGSVAEPGLVDWDDDVQIALDLVCVELRRGYLGEDAEIEYLSAALPWKPTTVDASTWQVPEGMRLEFDARGTGGLAFCVCHVTFEQGSEGKQEFIRLQELFLNGVRQHLTETAGIIDV
eukprot:TRINITY_DN50172_c0_g1_i1.p1 TRINITY_DN50172_c0_g1~~TRINITY_DN50172_c0_g1_i1.p1  ORF type:complete len:207 (+),score=28.67 TRINITY_DN50172_c0_g1_i1:72-692(+)